MENAESTDAVVIGGGLLGAATAYQLARGGRSVALVDRGDAGRATAAGAGILAPQTSTSVSDDLLELSFSALRHYLDLQHDLAADGFPDTGYGPNGLLLGPCCGMLLAESLATGRPPPELAPLRPSLTSPLDPDAHG